MCEQQTILLTGATGFLGSHLLEALLEKGHKVVVLKRSTSNTWRIEKLLPSTVSYDVDKQPLEMVFEEQRINSVIHTACVYGRKGESMHQVVESNLLFGLRVFDACIKYNTDTFFNTDTLLQKHLNIYALSKKQFVEWLEQQCGNVQVINLKIEHMYGPRDDTNKFIPWVLSQLRENVTEIKLTQGEQRRDFIHIDDVVSAYLITLEKSSRLPTFCEFDVGTGKLVTVRSFLEQLKKIYEIEINPVETKLSFGSIPYREGEMMTVAVNNQTLLNLGWSPKALLHTGLKSIVREYA
ncbi:NAD-dependent epimerase/dehydratase family protein [Leucothrix pacifica]|uniref:Epimerase n=1 Tax=Leucothrix pacifica TaxID=1247513 RepID=A0A317CEN4_9GAMM|nr:NAD-dependent epimerase/dehydratase family protein [Leucothrix pacifica]PWQ95803.1 epimerase [Leucothrix pacifica]